MAFYVIEAVHFGATGERVERVRWGKIKGGEIRPPAWSFEPEEDDVISVVDALRAGDDVCMAFPVPGGTVMGPHLKTVVYADGARGIETLDPDNHPGRTLQHLPTF
ncbi:MAG: hypothetical protein JWQ21_571 [Herminiimonas sp.]|nr:hypothetical protein [Herminiimonas sp.]